MYNNTPIATQVRAVFTWMNLSPKPFAFVIINRCQAHMMSEVRLIQVMNRLGYLSLSDNQQKAVVEFVGGRNVLVVLPTVAESLSDLRPLPWCCAIEGEGLARQVQVLAIQRSRELKMAGRERMCAVCQTTHTP